jgi:hypothetical protein
MYVYVTDISEAHRYVSEVSWAEEVLTIEFRYRP